MDLTGSVPFLSFCIPTYNKADIIFDRVMRILQYSGNDIEVAVTDDGSTDNTYERLQQIQDDRFKYFRNTSNIGFARNVIKSMEHASGDYLMYLSDRDIVITDMIPALIQRLKTGRPDVLLSSVLWQGSKLRKSRLEVLKKIYRRFKHGTNTDNYFIYCGLKNLDKVSSMTAILSRKHPTGIVLRKSRIELDLLNSLDKTFFDMYPHILVMLLANDHGTMDCTSQAFTITMDNPKSGTIRESIQTDGIPYPHPDSRYAQMMNRIDWIQLLSLTELEKIQILTFIFQDFLDAAIKGFRDYVSQEEFRVDMYEIRKKATVLKKEVEHLANQPTGVEQFINQMKNSGQKFLNECLTDSKH